MLCDVQQSRLLTRPGEHEYEGESEEEGGGRYLDVCGSVAPILVVALADF